MSSKMERDKQKQLQDKCQNVLNELLRDEDNKYCVDCDAKGPRWASWNIGIFLCIRCAGIHRNLGVHISKVKSVNLDAWTPEQVVSLQQMGNSRARAVYEANLPDNFRRPHNDTNLESFIRAKYEHKKYIAREWVQPPLPKVNWEKEIEEEMEKQKRKKKTVVEKKVISVVEVPQIPKPKSASPKPVRTSTGSVNEDKAVQNVDLLGSQNSDDTFSNFLSAAPKEATKDDQKDSLKNEEENFFNQTSINEKEKIKLTKDSILALYGSAPPVNYNQNQILYNSQQTGYSNFVTGIPVNNVTNGMVQYPAPTGQYQQFSNHLQQFNVPAFSGNPSVPSMYQANIPQMQYANGVQSTNQFSMNGIQTGNQFPSNNLPTGNQFLANGIQGSNQFLNTGMPSANQFCNSAIQVNQVPLNGPVVNMTATPNTNLVANTAAINPFYVNQANSVQQQFANLTIGNSSNNTTPTQLTSNIFQ